MQENDLSRLLTRHHELVIKSNVLPKFNCAPFSITAGWNPLDAMTALEQAQVNLVKAQLGAVYLAAGVIEEQEERDRIVADADSGYSGLPEKLPPMPDTAAPGDPGDPTAPGAPDGQGSPSPTIKPPKPAAAPIRVAPGA